MAAVPGSMPRTITRRPAAEGRGARRSTRDVGEALLGDVEVGGHPRDVLEVLERLHEAQVLAGSLLVDRDRALGDHRALGVLDGHAGALERLADLLEAARRRVHLDNL